ncbi:uncharacterized protein LOC121725285 [Aricia agestis]|uniref:uncharacterized protein LOC121725285 n=1 Tax=Aricia agestis TaxID=91739 RepID=UPI001C20B4A0|nr:uncharacterized protein LOC121725285 [Aricia agestis]
MNWIWIFMYFITIVYGYNIYYYYEGKDKGYRGRPWPVNDTCSSRRRRECRNWCLTPYYACEEMRCYCIYTWYRYVYKDKRGPRTENNALRHHIAHFCPNVDEAKQCIFKCMKTGQPAFCGRDNVCYCGHRYTPMDDNSKNNTKATYSQYKELYQKYFGPNYADDYEVIQI